MIQANKLDIRKTYVVYAHNNKNGSIEWRSGIIISSFGFEDKELVSVFPIGSRCTYNQLMDRSNADLYDLPSDVVDIKVNTHVLKEHLEASPNHPKKEEHINAIIDNFNTIEKHFSTLRA
ncbi:hypothetical protein HN924_02165 [Candidatus Woesearchaeota archaeon]|jgi:hypothetical protein|nr:hypothetical protein [Candidatus Woesearchaeota archaeon]MBT7062749.1 hypothetical protein [Candidatus Woesearchaeota archaeon]MBT7402675.1 hypothetical protein [Candidatus Woesearchaeota archaeon]